MTRPEGSGRGRGTRPPRDDGTSTPKAATGDAAGGTDPSRVGRYRIGAVAHATGISTHTLRVWERRYDAFALSRTDGGVRLYSDADVERVRRLKLLQAQGHPIGLVARLDDAELAHLLARGGLGTPTTPTTPSTPRPAPAPAPGGHFSAVQEGFLAAVRVYDLAAAERLLLGAVVANDPRRLALELLPPLFEEIGRRWEVGEFKVAHEHAASALLRNALGTILGSHRPSPRAGTLVTTTLSGELHEFGALLAALLAASLGWNAIYLGPNLPAEQILLAADESQASAVLVSVVHVGGSAAARHFGEELRRLREGLAAGVALVAGGAAVDRLSASFSGVAVMEDLSALESWLLAHGS